VRAAVAEQLALAGRPSGRAATRAFLNGRDHGGRDHDGLGHDGLGDGARARARFETLPPHQRTALLMQVAASRAATTVLVVAAPDRLGGDPRLWWKAAEALAAEGLTVVVQCTHVTARDLGQEVHYELGVSA
jgi:hypothetical protein